MSVFMTPASNVLPQSAGSALDHNLRSSVYYGQHLVNSKPFVFYLHFKYFFFSRQQNTRFYTKLCANTGCTSHRNTLAWYALKVEEKDERLRKNEMSAYGIQM